MEQEMNQTATCGCDCAQCVAGHHENCEKGPCDGTPVDKGDKEE